jgi:hypothetical protein
MTIPIYEPFVGDEEDVDREEESEEGADDDKDEDNEDDDEAGEDSPLTTPTDSTLYMPAPSIEAAKSALKDLGLVLRPPWRNGQGYKDPKLDLLLQHHLECMQALL